LTNYLPLRAIRKEVRKMLHSRQDYNERVQDSAGIIPEAEPVFLLRAQDVTAPEVVEYWAYKAKHAGASLEVVKSAREQAEAMRRWQRNFDMKIPDLP